MPSGIGPYEILGKLAAGGMAEVFLARDRGPAGFSRDLVVKRLFHHLAEQAEPLRLFQDEARILALLSHPNIPQAYALGHADGTWYLAMEYVDGPTVAALWDLARRAGGSMPLPVALGLVVQACEALEHAHVRRDRSGRPLAIVHRDVNPTNLMVTRDGVTKVMDFGVAWTAAASESKGTVRGTYRYMAPEQVQGWPLDRRADVFALAVVLYELTTGTRLFEGPDIEVMGRVVEEDAPDPRTRVAGYPDALAELVNRGLQRDPTVRLGSAAALGRGLADFAMERGLYIGPPSLAAYLRRIAPATLRREEARAAATSSPPAPRPADTAPPAHWGEEDEEGLPEIDEAELLDELEFLSEPPGTPSEDG
jgi:serine/threonine protein kinase